MSSIWQFEKLALRFLRSKKVNFSGKTVLLDEVGIVETLIQGYQPGRVKYQATYWNAINLENQTIEAGMPVRVLGLSNITLIVEPIQLG